MSNQSFEDLDDLLLDYDHITEVAAEENPPGINTVIKSALDSIKNNDRQFIDHGIKIAQVRERAYLCDVYGRTLFRLGYHDEGIALLRKATEHDDGISSATALAYALEKTGARTEALEVYNHILEQYPTNIEGLIGKGYTLCTLAVFEALLPWI